MDGNVRCSGWFDEENKEYPPMILDSLDRTTSNVLPIIRGVRADNKFNGRMATATRMFLENRSLYLPVTSSGMRREHELDDDEKQKQNNRSVAKKGMAIEETAVFIETDALQYEMGNIVPQFTTSGNITYNTQSAMLHKDRYTAIAMGLEWILCLEEINKESLRDDSGDFCLGSSYVF
jgi:hypothetical protein